MASLCADCKIFFDCEWCISGGTRLPRGAEYHTKDIRCDKQTKQLVIITKCPYHIPEREEQESGGKSSHLGTPLTAYDINGNRIGTYKSISAAVRALNISPHRLRYIYETDCRGGFIDDIRIVFEPKEKWGEIKNEVETR